MGVEWYIWNRHMSQFHLTARYLQDTLEELSIYATTSNP